MRFIIMRHIRERRINGAYLENKSVAETINEIYWKYQKCSKGSAKSVRDAVDCNKSEC